MRESDPAVGAGCASMGRADASWDGEISALLRLLDDGTPEVRRALECRFAELDGDLSEHLALFGVELDAADLLRISRMLQPGRRRRLEEEWQSPLGGAAALGEDWDAMESLLRSLSDFLHDGVTLRQPLSDVLDLVAEEAEECGVGTAEELRVFLFEDGRYVANESGSADPRNLDLAWVAESGCSDAWGLSVLYVLVARRLGLEVEVVDYPGHFFCRIHEGGRAYLIDCFDSGRSHLQDVLMRRADIGRAEKQYLAASLGPGGVLLRVLEEVRKRLRKCGRNEDAMLIGRLHALL